MALSIHFDSDSGALEVRDPQQRVHWRTWGICNWIGPLNVTPRTYRLAGRELGLARFVRTDTRGSPGDVLYLTHAPSVVPAGEEARDRITVNSDLATFHRLDDLIAGGHGDVTLTTRHGDGSLRSPLLELIQREHALGPPELRMVSTGRGAGPHER